MSYSYPDVLCIPGSGGTANLGSVICQAPKGATNQYQGVSYYGDATPQPTGAHLYQELNTRFPHGQVVSIGQ